MGSVNFALPAVTSTRVPSSSTVTGFDGSDRDISASNFPGTKTFPVIDTSAGKLALLEVSRSDPERRTSLFCTSITIPSKAVIIGRVERLRETQWTASANACCSTVNFTPHLS